MNSTTSLRVSALITSVCQFRWLGADDWEKLPSDGLQDGFTYWISTIGDRQSVTTIETCPGNLIRLMIPNSSTRWRLIHRAWERIKRLRKTPFIELRERSLMAENHARNVVIVREEGA